MKRSFFQAAVISILLYGSTTWTLTKRLEEKLDGNYTRMLRAILNKSWRQNPTRHQLYGHLPPITKTIQIRRTKHAWTPTYGRAKAGRPAWKYIQQLCENTGCSPEDLPEAGREKWRERVWDIRASGTTWWWWRPLKNITQLNSKLGFSVTHFIWNFIQFFKISLYCKFYFSSLKPFFFLLCNHALHWHWSHSWPKFIMWYRLCCPYIYVVSVCVCVCACVCVCVWKVYKWLNKTQKFNKFHISNFGENFVENLSYKIFFFKNKKVILVRKYSQKCTVQERKFRFFSM